VRVIYRLLGDLEISRDGDQALRLPSGHALVVLSVLLINANQRMSKPALLQAAWGSADVSEAQLHKTAAALRALLAQIGRGDDLVTHTRFGYEIRIPDEDLDMLLFRRWLRQAELARSQGHLGDEVSHLRQALGLWRGLRPLSNVPSEAFAQEIDRLEQRHKRAAVRLFDLELAQHGHDRIVDDLALMSSYHPGDRRLCEQLMIAAYLCGHATDAAAAYERHSAGLAEQTGAEPDPALRTLHYAIASGNEPVIEEAESAIAIRAGLPSSPGLAVSFSVPRQLPPDQADLLGRNDLVAEASWLLGRPPGHAVPVVVICGPGGIGKTALVRRVAHLLSDRYPDGQLYTELRGTTDEPARASEVLAQFLRAFGVPTVPEELPERVAAFRTAVAERRVLIVLDDAASGAQIRDLIPASPACGVLVTARQRLPDLDGTHHLPPLAPLNRAASTQLFVRAVGEARIDLGAERDAVERVVALCGGLPLALRIAAALRVHDHPRPTAELADRLAVQGPEAFTYGELSLARTIGAGFDRLNAEARQLFLDLGMLRLPSFGLWTAAALRGGAETDAAAALSQLAASSMIELAEPGVRYRFHDLTQEYAARRALAEQPSEDERNAVAARVYRALLTLTRRAHASLYGGDFEVVHCAVPDWDAPQAVLAEIDAAPQEWFDKERLTIRAAVSHCALLGLTDICWDLAVSAHEFYTIGGYFDDWYATHMVALRACRAAGDRRGEGVLLASLGQPALVASRRAGVSGLTELQRSVDLLADCQDRHGQAIALRTLANALRRRGHLTRPLALFNEALAHYEASGDIVGRWLTLRYIGQTYLDLGRQDEALRVLETAERVAGELGRPRLLAQTRYWIGQTRLAVGDLDGAAAAFNSVLGAYPEPATTGHAYAVHGLGDVALLTGALEDADRYLRLAAELAGDGADAALEGRAHLSAAALYAATRQPDSRIAALEQAVTCFAEAGTAYLQAVALAALARAHEDSADSAAARAALARLESLYQEMALPEEDRIHHTPPGPAR
jgi:DNA-binding SARP family transcriptional activator/tetratricopeptide (TPR) repeat protein